MTAYASKKRSGEYNLIGILFTVVICLIFITGYWTHVGMAIVTACVAFALIIACVIGPQKEKNNELPRSKLTRYQV